MPNDSFGISYNLRNMHQTFSFFGFIVIAIGSQSKKHRLSTTLPSTTEKDNFWDFSSRNIWELSVILAQFQIDAYTSSFKFNLLCLPIQIIMSLDYSALKQSSALIFALGIYLCLNTILGVNMAVIGRCTSEQKPFSALFIGSNANLSPHFLHP